MGFTPCRWSKTLRNERLGGQTIHGAIVISWLLSSTGLDNPSLLVRELEGMKPTSQVERSFSTVPKITPSAWRASQWLHLHRAWRRPLSQWLEQRLRGNVQRSFINKPKYVCVCACAQPPQAPYLFIKNLDRAVLSLKT